MFSLLQELHKNDVELKIVKASATGTVMRFTLRSNAHCMVRYFNLDGPESNAEDATLLRLLHIFYEEFMEEKGRREELAKSLVREMDDSMAEAVRQDASLRCAMGIATEEEWRIFQEKLRPATDGGDICVGQERKAEEER